MIDLHIHSNCSDGSSTVCEILEEANRQSLSLLSLTDHNVVDAYDILKEQKVRKLFSGKIITGIEVTTSVDGEIVELLGYGYDYKKLKDLMIGEILTYKDYKLKECQLAFEAYEERGIAFDKSNIIFDPEVEGCRGAFFKELLRYPENRKRLLNGKSEESLTKFTRLEFYNPKSDFYVDQTKIYITFEKTIEIIHKAGGLVFLAHPYMYSENITSNLQSIIDRFDIDGLECYYSEFTEEQTEALLKLCDQNNLLVSGGSDFHGTKREGVHICTGYGKLMVDENRCNKWTDKIEDFR